MDGGSDGEECDAVDDRANLMQSSSSRPPPRPSPPRDTLHSFTLELLFI